MMSIILWLRRDLRLSDHEPLLRAVAAKRPIIPLFILDETEAQRLGGASRWWLHNSLQALAKALAAKGSRLILRRGDPLHILPEMQKLCGAEAVFWHRLYGPGSAALEARLQELLPCATRAFSGHLLFEPDTIRNQKGEPYRVFTPFWRACLKAEKPEAPAASPSRIPAPERWPASADLSDLQLLPQIPWYEGMAAAWQAGEEGAERELRRFTQQKVQDYVSARDFPSLAGTSRLSPYLAWGEMSPRSVWAAFSGVKAAVKPGEDGERGAAFLRQIAWREFSQHLLFHFPQTVSEPLRPEFSAFPWDDDPMLLAAWQRGRTGYPIVDAGMRELWSTGWMHNRVRMIVGSFLVKDLLLPWQAGAAWFWDTLVDADLGNNTMGWQWISGCGADAAPYFRVFNPKGQGERFDPEGTYVRRWIPELKGLDAAWIHCPEKAPAAVLAKAGCVLGVDYPRPVVDHREARLKALIAYEKIKVGASATEKAKPAAKKKGSSRRL